MYSSSSHYHQQGHSSYPTDAMYTEPTKLSNNYNNYNSNNYSNHSDNNSVSGDEYPSGKFYEQPYESSFRQKQRGIPGVENFFTHKSNVYDEPDKDYLPQTLLAPIASFNLQQQELVLLEDLFSILLGFQGNYLALKNKKSNRSHQAYYVKIPSDTDRSIAEMLKKIARIAEDYIQVKEFILIYSSPTAGQVNQALCAALKALELEYMEQIVSLEQNFRASTTTHPFTLQTLWVQLAARSSIMNRLASLVNVIYHESKKIQIQSRLRDQELGIVTSVDNDSFHDNDDDDNYDNDNDNDNNDNDNDNDNHRNHNETGSHFSTDSLDDSPGSNDASSDDFSDTSASNFNTDESIRENDPQFPQNQFGDNQNFKKRSRRKRKKFRGSYKVVSVRGGYTLNVITRAIKKSSGDQVSTDIYAYLLSRAAEPFLELLTQWLHHGTIGNIASFEIEQKEFMISRSEGKVPAAIAGTEEVIVINNPDFKKSTSNVIRFTLDNDLTPEFLQPWSKKILLTGKYTNVVAECHANMEHLSPPSIVIKASDNHSHILETNVLMAALNGRVIVREIEDAYKRANTALLEVLFEKKYLPGYLNAAKRYLLLDQADFLTNFFDLAGNDLEKYPTSDMLNHLNLLLEQTLKNPASTTYSDDFKERISLSFASEKLIESLKLLQLSDLRPRSHTFQGLPDSNADHNQQRHQAQVRMQTNSGKNSENMQNNGPDAFTCSKFFCMHLEADFPASLVLNAISMRKYTLLHRYILGLKYLEWRLSSAWLEHSKTYFGISKKTRKTAPASQASLDDSLMLNRLEKEFDTVKMRQHAHLTLFTLRNKMLVCTQQILYYLFCEIIEPNWKMLISSITSAKTVDEVISSHNQFLDSGLLQCGLTNPKLFKNLNRLTSMCTYLVKNSAYVCDSKSFFNTGILTKESLFTNSSSATNPSSSSVTATTNISDADPMTSTTISRFSTGSPLGDEVHDNFAPFSQTTNRSSNTDFNSNKSMKRVSSTGVGTIESTDSNTGVNKQIEDTIKMLEHISNSFSSSLNTIMEALNHYAQSQSPKYLNLAARLDFIKTKRS